jgi:hypothetical protein
MYGPDLLTLRQAGPRLVLTTSARLTSASLAALLGTGAPTGYVTIIGPPITLGFGLGIVVPSMTSALLGSIIGVREC